MVLFVGIIGVVFSSLSYGLTQRRSVFNWLAVHSKPIKTHYLSSWSKRLDSLEEEITVSVQRVNRANEKLKPYFEGLVKNTKLRRWYPNTEARPPVLYLVTFQQVKRGSMRCVGQISYRTTLLNVRTPVYPSRVNKKVSFFKSSLPCNAG